MVNQCAFANCNNRAHRWVPKSFHYFPLKDPERAKLWLLAAGLDVQTPMETLRIRVICSDHFSSDDFIKSRKSAKKILKPSAVPSAFPGIPRTATVVQTVSEEQFHPSIRKGLSFPPLEICVTCCSLYHCPLCSPVNFKPTNRSRVMTHLDNHIRKACYVGEYTIHKCGLECRGLPHYHCLHCDGTLAKKQDFLRHVSVCQEKREKKEILQLAEDPQRVQTSRFTGESVSSSSCIESSDDSDKETIIPDFEDDTSLEGCSRQPLFFSRSSERDGVGRMMSAQPDSFQCDKMVQTYIEKPQDCDEYYFMNLVKMFKRLTPKKKADVRMKIERILFEAEFQ
ncbi:uncharacterized protein PAE49_011020 isoform 1-T1 [Odontesthes bonariensis]